MTDSNKYALKLYAKATHVDHPPRVLPPPHFLPRLLRRLDDGVGPHHREGHPLLHPGVLPPLPLLHLGQVLPVGELVDADAALHDLEKRIKMIFPVSIKNKMNK